MAGLGPPSSGPVPGEGSAAVGWAGFGAAGGALIAGCAGSADGTDGSDLGLSPAGAPVGCGWAAIVAAEGLVTSLGAVAPWLASAGTGGAGGLMAGAAGAAGGDAGSDAGLAAAGAVCVSVGAAGGGAGSDAELAAVGAAWVSAGAAGSDVESGLAAGALLAVVSDLPFSAVGAVVSVGGESDFREFSAGDWPSALSAGRADGILGCESGCG